MEMINYVIGDATQPEGSGTKIIAHVCNDKSGWGKGFVLALSKRYREPEAVFRAAFRQDPKPVQGDIQMICVGPDLYVCNMIAQTLGDPSGVNLKYTALEACLSKLADEATRMAASVHSPRFGAGLAGGKWETIEQIVGRRLLARNVKVTIYDLA